MPQYPQNLFYDFCQIYSYIVDSDSTFAAKPILFYGKSDLFTTNPQADGVNSERI